MEFLIINEAAIVLSFVASYICSLYLLPAKIARKVNILFDMIETTIKVVKKLERSKGGFSISEK